MAKKLNLAEFNERVGGAPPKQYNLPDAPMDREDRERYYAERDERRAGTPARPSARPRRAPRPRRTSRTLRTPRTRCFAPS
jgi:hypothetical protein